MTLVIGVLCTDGIVVGADSRATYALPSGEKTVEQDMDSKINIVDDKMVCAFSGSNGMGQDVLDSLTKTWGKIQRRSLENIKSEMTNTIASIVKDYAQRRNVAAMAFGSDPESMRSAQFVVGLVSQNRPALLHFNARGDCEEVHRGLSFIAIGSGQPFADPFVSFVKRVAWFNGKPETIRQGIVGVLWSIQYVTEVNPGEGVGGPESIGVLRKGKNSWQSDELKGELLDEYRGAIDSAESRIHEELNKVASKDETSDPPRLQSK